MQPETTGTSEINIHLNERDGSIQIVIEERDIEDPERWNQMFKNRYNLPECREDLVENVANALFDADLASYPAKLVKINDNVTDLDNNPPITASEILATYKTIVDLRVEQIVIIMKQQMVFTARRNYFE